MPGHDLVIKGENKGPKLLSGEGSAVGLLADYAVAAQITDLPPEVIDHARRVLLDTIGVILGGSIAPEATALAHRLGRQDGGPSTIIGHALRASTLNAALANGTAATWLDYDSGHRPPPGKPLLPAAHPPIHLVPAILGVSEEMAASGPDVLVALVVGYEAGARIGMASRVRAEIHPHGTYHNVGAAVAAARLKGVDRDRMESTIGLAIHLTLMPSFQNAYQGRTVRNTYAAIGATSGILASILATANFTPEHDAIGSVFGGVISPWLDPERITEELGQRFEITQGFIKPYPMCRFGHPAVEAAEALINQYEIVSEEIDTVEVRTFGWAATLDDREPKTDLGAKFSIPWAVASMLVRKSAGPDDFRGEALADDKLRAVAARITVREDPSYTSMTPSKRPASVTVRTKRGDTFHWEVERSGGGPDAPLSAEKVQEKFRSLADPVIGPEQATVVADIVANLHELSDIRELTALLMPPGPIKNCRKSLRGGK